MKIYWGYDSFREGQETIINTITSGRDALAVMPTGAGKSICYQLPSLMLPGITIVISPLISLMQDQVKALNEAGIRAAYINSSLTPAQVTKALNFAAEGKYKIMYVAPERLESAEFLRFAEKAEISLVTVDEAHCISQWGQDFRPSYMKIMDFVNSLPQRPVLAAFTATATEEVKEDIECILNLQNPEVAVTGFDRKNLFYSVEAVKREAAKRKANFVLDFVASHANESGIIYCSTRKSVEAVCELLLAKGVAATRYHAGLDNETRKQNQNDFIYDKASVMVATNAFGMGIDKPNVRYVIHYNMPQSMENYYQEAGRAGRDGEPAQCILLFSEQDIMINKFLLEHKSFTDIAAEDIMLIRQRDAQRLQAMANYCRTTECLRNYILEYFGEKTNEPCGSCGNCRKTYRDVDMTFQAKQVINCIAEAKGRYGQNIILGILLGANRARLKEIGAVDYKSYGRLENEKERELKMLVSQMIAKGYIYQSEDQYDVLKVGNIEPLKNADAHVIVKLPEEKADELKFDTIKRRTADFLTAAGYELFEALRALRLETAREEALPPYIIFGDRTLVDMCVKAPQNEAEMLNVSGVGTAKLEKYGSRFLAEIAKYKNEHPNAVLSIADPNDLSEETVVKPPKKKRKKAEFYLNAVDAEKFAYQDLYFISEIKDELNRITTAENAKKITGTRISEFLLSEGWIEETEANGRNVKTQTAKGLQVGIVTIHRVSKIGYPYTLLKYPPDIQKLIVEHYTKKIDCQENC